MSCRQGGGSCMWPGSSLLRRGLGPVQLGSGCSRPFSGAGCLPAQELRETQPPLCPHPSARLFLRPPLQAMPPHTVPGHYTGPCSRVLWPKTCTPLASGPGFFQTTSGPGNHSAQAEPQGHSSWAPAPSPPPGCKLPPLFSALSKFFFGLLETKVRTARGPHSKSVPEREEGEMERGRNERQKPHCTSPFQGSIQPHKELNRQREWGACHPGEKHGRSSDTLTQNHRLPQPRHHWGCTQQR